MRDSKYAPAPCGTLLTACLVAAALAFGGPAPPALGQQTPPPAPPGPAAYAAAQALAQSRAADAADSAETPEAPDESMPPRVEPPDGEWLVDEDGHRYFIERIRKGIEGRDFKWIGEDRIRLWGGLPLEVVAHDDESFSVKIYEIPEPRAPAPPPAPPTEAELAAVAASYTSDLASRDALRFVDFGGGLPRQGQWRNGFGIGDMNGDGHLDIVFGRHRKGRPSPNIFLSDGKGSWRWWAEATFPDLPYDYGDAAVADFDLDGHLDVALGMHLTGVVVLRGDGAGHFTAWSDGIAVSDPRRSDSTGVFSSRAITVTDWNRDGKPDILAIGEGMARAAVRQKTLHTLDPASATGIQIFVNHGDGSWHAERVSSNIFGDAVAIGDVNGDGYSDIVAATARLGSRHILYLGAEDGTWTAAALESLRPMAWIKTVAVADLDANGIDDIVVGYSNSHFGVWRTGIDLFYSRGENRWQRRGLFAREGREGVYSLATGDLDGDGTLDLAAMTGDGEPWIFLGDGEGFFVREDSPELPEPIPGCSGYALGLADVDRDGRDEMIVGLAGEPQGYQGFPGLGGLPGCPGGGSLRAWSVEPAEAAVEPAEAAVEPAEDTAGRGMR